MAANKSTKKVTRRDVTVVIFSPRQGSPSNLLAQAGLRFESGLMAGLTLTGIALWKATHSNGTHFVSVTFPARAIERQDEVSYYDHVRGKGEDIKRLKAAIVAAYEAYLVSKAQEAPAA